MKHAQKLLMLLFLIVLPGCSEDSVSPPEIVTVDLRSYGTQNFATPTGLELKWLKEDGDLLGYILQILPNDRTIVFIEAEIFNQRLRVKNASLAGHSPIHSYKLLLPHEMLAIVNGDTLSAVGEDWDYLFDKDKRPIGFYGEFFATGR